MANPTDTPDDRAPFKPQDVLRYSPTKQWCHEGTAIVGDDGVARDTYWVSGRTRLSPDELASATVEFNLDEVDPLPGGTRWQDFHPDDRRSISAQHRLQWTYYVRRGAIPDLPTRIANARAEVEKAESAVRSAESDLDWCRRVLAGLEGEIPDSAAGRADVAAIYA